MVVPSPNTIPDDHHNQKMRGHNHQDRIPIIDLSRKKSIVKELILKASEKYGFFRVINHGVPEEITQNMEKEGLDFFAKSASEKQKAGPPNPLGYGVKNIGFSGDVGEVEYLLLDTNPQSLSQRSKSISKDPANFSYVVNEYVQAVRNLACEILDVMAEGLWAHDKSVFSSLIRDVDADSLIRLNHYPSIKETSNAHSEDMDLQNWDTSSLPQFHHPHHHHHHHHQMMNNVNKNRIGFGEHSDPQILTILTSNGVEGLQIFMENGEWVPVPPDPSAFCVNVGDVLQALTNGRFKSARHRVIANSMKARLSMVYFGAPPPHAWISPLPEILSPQSPPLYRPFTWCEYKKATYSLRLGDGRLDLFRIHDSDRHLHHHQHDQPNINNIN